MKGPRATPPTLATTGEMRLIESIRQWLGPACPPAPRGIGDDCAVLPPAKGRMLITVDPVVKGRHFDDSLPPRLVAAKLLKRNLSDIAAMGGTPAHAVVALAAPGDLPLAWVRDFYRGLARAALACGVVIVGGDCTQTDGFLGAFLTLTGTAPSRPLTREGARAGDRLFVTGSLGGSLLRHHATFAPRLREGAWLAAHRGVRAAIDVSDGLGKDLFALAGAETRVVVQADAIPISPAARRLSRRDGRHVLAHAINDGEDFELLFAATRGTADELVRAWRDAFQTRLTCIGWFEPRQPKEPGVCFEPPLPPGVTPKGYEHFR